MGEKYIEFAERRIGNQFNEDLNESIYVASCGDEFFRDLDVFISYAKNSNPMHPADEHATLWSFGEHEFYQHVKDVNYRVDVIGLLHQNTDTVHPYNTIIFEACPINNFSFLFTRIQFTHTFSSYGTDFHIMRYNDMMHRSEPVYVWLLVGWIQFNGRIWNLLDEF